MPTIIRIRGLRVFLWPGDHIPPQFHILGPGYTARVRIEDLAVSDERGRRPAGFFEVMQWARANRAVLEGAWEAMTREGRS